MYFSLSSEGLVSTKKAIIAWHCFSSLLLVPVYGVQGQQWLAPLPNAAPESGLQLGAYLAGQQRCPWLL